MCCLSSYRIKINRKNIFKPNHGRGERGRRMRRFRGCGAGCGVRGRGGGAVRVTDPGGAVRVDTVFVKARPALWPRVTTREAKGAGGWPPPRDGRGGGTELPVSHCTQGTLVGGLRRAAQGAQPPAERSSLFVHSPTHPPTCSPTHCPTHPPSYPPTHPGAKPLSASPAKWAHGEPAPAAAPVAPTAARPAVWPGQRGQRSGPHTTLGPGLGT